MRAKLEVMRENRQSSGLLAPTQENVASMRTQLPEPCNLSSRSKQRLEMVAGTATLSTCDTKSRRSAAKVIAETICLVHALMQDRHGASVAIRRPSPSDEMMFESEVESIDAGIGREAIPWLSIRSNAVNRFVM